MQQLIGTIYQTVGSFLPSIVAALLLLIGGWFLALLLSATVRKGLERTTLDNRLADRIGIDTSKFNLEVIAGKIVYYTVMLFVLIVVFQTLSLTIVTGPLNSLLDKVFSFLPNLLAAGGLLFLAWVIATVSKLILTKVLGATQLDDRLSGDAGLQAGQTPMSETLANVVYWFIFLLFLPAILGALQMEGLLAPVRNMVDDLLGFLPNVLGAGIILLVGWFVARIVRQIVTSLLVAVGADNLGERVGLSAVAGGQTLSGIIGTVLYVLIIIPVVISALNALQIEAISEPATNMLTTLLEAIPAIFGAMIVLGIAYLIGRLVAGLITNLLTTVGFNRVLNLIGLGSEPAEGQRTPAEVVGYLIIIGIMFFATIEAANLLGFTILADLAAELLTFASQVILAVIIFGLGLYLANLAHSVISSTAGAQANLLAQAARLAIIILVSAMALRQMGIADDIVNLAFGLILGAIAVAAALAFGLGARDLAGRELEGWVTQLRSGQGKQQDN